MLISYYDDIVLILGIPVPIVAISAGVAHDQYGSETL